MLREKSQNKKIRENLNTQKLPDVEYLFPVHLNTCGVEIIKIPTVRGSVLCFRIWRL